mmetsp:Transcript_39146/g.63351  ORF Transcript_39146/g.63351 Transcript_39146/m.63351 type:complete len:301 (+) Transcript_39146:13800-14702(+)
MLHFQSVIASNNVPSCVLKSRLICKTQRLHRSFLIPNCLVHSTSTFCIGYVPGKVICISTLQSSFSYNTVTVREAARGVTVILPTSTSSSPPVPDPDGTGISKANFLEARLISRISRLTITGVMYLVRRALISEKSARFTLLPSVYHFRESIGNVRNVFTATSCSFFVTTSPFCSKLHRNAACTRPFSSSSEVISSRISGSIRRIRRTRNTSMHQASGLKLLSILRYINSFCPHQLRTSVSLFSVQRSKSKIQLQKSSSLESNKIVSISFFGFSVSSESTLCTGTREINVTISLVKSSFF